MGAGNGQGSSLSVYMVFPYMDHDLAGLLENERVKLQPSHIKLYMKQLLEGTEYMHRVSKSLELMVSLPPLFVTDHFVGRADSSSTESHFTS